MPPKLPEATFELPVTSDMIRQALQLLYPHIQVDSVIFHVPTLKTAPPPEAAVNGNSSLP